MASYYLTRRAASDLRNIKQYSVEKWGESVAKTYIKDLYIGFQEIADKPSLGTLRQQRSNPFLMVPIREHFIVFELLNDDIIVLTILHQVRDIEGIILSFEAKFLKDIERLKNLFQKQTKQ